MDCRNFSGLTLLELLVSVSIGSILLLVVLPSSIEMVRTSRLNSQTHVFISAVNYARTAALERQHEVYICVHDGGICQDRRNWELGWLVFVDENRNQSPDPQEVLHVFGALEQGYTLTPNLPVSQLLFLPGGDVRRGSRALPMMTFRLCSPDAQDGKLVERSREIVINATGRMRLQFGREIAGAC